MLLLLFLHFLNSPNQILIMIFTTFFPPTTGICVSLMQSCFLGFTSCFSLIAALPESAFFFLQRASMVVNNNQPLHSFHYHRFHHISEIHKTRHSHLSVPCLTVGDLIFLCYNMPSIITTSLIDNTKVSILYYQQNIQFQNFILKMSFLELLSLSTVFILSFRNKL